MVVQNFKDLKCLKRRELLEVYDDANFNHKLFETSWAVLSLEGRLYLWEQLVAPDHSGGGRRAPLAMVSTLLWCGGLVASPGQACCCTNRDPGKCIMAWPGGRDMGDMGGVHIHGKLQLSGGKLICQPGSRPRRKGKGLY
eukprot:TRINITY_DN2229_c0_g1_i15.p2 TRINITY_DN2229_c0_g1~~TRINITY_DN2229_c0_g1_i15.p2  ORF type:complete len:140 (+),score=16.95 TRINITY_DN2229_c0_g1_i15:177-596(+)